MARVEGKVALITGAARGQGRSHAVRLAEEGADIVAVDLCGQIESVPYGMATPDDLAQTAKLVEEQDRRIVTAQADVRDAGQLRAAVEEGLSQFGHIDIVSANAGIASYGPAHELDETAWRDMLDVNLTGVWQTCKAVIPSMIEAGRGGSIMFTSSIGGLKGIQHVAHYVAAKHGIVGLMRTLANELGPHSIRVNCVNPSGVATRMVLNPAVEALFGGGDDPAPEPKPVDDVANLFDVPLVQVEDVTAAVAFLASDEARYITGVALPVDAGMLVR
jgi:SDR family mycofactocin-dependent oxidoreductase